MSDEVTTDRDVLKAIAVGCRQDHQPSIEAARRLLTGLAAAPAATLSEVMDVMFEGGVFTDESVETEVQDGEPVKDSGPLARCLAPCGHPLDSAMYVGTPAAQNLWKCRECEKEFLR